MSAFSFLACRRVSARLLPYVEDRAGLSAPERSLVQAHLADCAACREEARRLESDLRQLRGLALAPAPDPSPALWGRVAAELAVAPRRRAPLLGSRPLPLALGSVAACLLIALIVFAAGAPRATEQASAYEAAPQIASAPQPAAATRAVALPPAAPAADVASPRDPLRPLPGAKGVTTLGLPPPPQPAAPAVTLGEARRFAEAPAPARPSEPALRRPPTSSPPAARQEAAKSGMARRAGPSEATAPAPAGPPPVSVADRAEEEGFDSLPGVGGGGGAAAPGGFGGGIAPGRPTTGRTEAARTRPTAAAPPALSVLEEQARAERTQMLFRHGE